jgi:hypothetical protein
LISDLIGAADVDLTCCAVLAALVRSSFKIWSGVIGCIIIFWPFKLWLKPNEMRQPLCFLSLFFCLFSGSILSLSLSFSFFSFLFFVSVFFDVTEGEKQGSGVDSVCGVIKWEMVAAR